MGTQKSRIQKTYEIDVGADKIEIDIFESNRQFDWLEYSLVYDKNEQHATIYDSYNLELAAKTKKSIRLSNFTDIYSLTNEKKYNIDNLIQKHLLYKQLVAWSCDGSNVAPLTDYMNNLIYQELIDEDDYNDAKSDKKVYFDLRASSGYTNETERLQRNQSKISVSIQLKTAVTKNLG